MIDQCNLKVEQAFGNLNDIAVKVKNSVNKKLLKQHHSFDVKNTNTKYYDEAMQLSLTYFAVTNQKPAFAIETSKNLSNLSQKVFYQLLAIEEYMKIMGINNHILLDLTNIKTSLSYIPIKSKSNEFNFSHPLEK